MRRGRLTTLAMSTNEVSASSDAMLRFLLLILIFPVLILVLGDLLLARFWSDHVPWDWASCPLPQYQDVARLIIKGHKIAPYLLALLIFYCVRPCLWRIDEL